MCPTFTAAIFGRLQLCALKLKIIFYFIQVLLPLIMHTLDSVPCLAKVYMTYSAMEMSLGCLIAGTAVDIAHHQVEFAARGKLWQVC